MRFFTKSTKARDAEATKPTVTICSYNLGAGFEDRHKLIPIEDARRRAQIVYRPLSNPAKELVVARRSPLEELAQWAAREALELRRTSPAFAESKMEYADGLLTGAFRAAVADDEDDVYSYESEEEDLCERYSPKPVTPDSPFWVDPEGDNWATEVKTVRYRSGSY